MSTVLERSVTPARPRMSRGLRLWLAALAVCMAAGLGAWVYQLVNGLAVTNMRNPMMWGLYITFFMFFVGLSAGGLIVASAGRLFGARSFKPITRLAVLEATVAVMMAAMFLLPDIGRPDRVWHLFRYPHFTSPLIWDVLIVTIYFLLSLTYVRLYSRATWRAPAAVCFGPAAEADCCAMTHKPRWLGSPPAAFLLHSISA